MKALLALLVSFSIFATPGHDPFAHEKEETLKRLQTAKAHPTVLTCIENARTMDEMAACENAPEGEPRPENPKVQAKAPTPPTPAPTPNPPKAPAPTPTPPPAAH